jgi:2-oxoglutarate ferredoxin oxidoreductase subunit alpha
MKKDEVSILIGGKAGEGISSAGLVISQLIGCLGYRAYMYFDYPSLIKGGHNFAVIRGGHWRVGATRRQVDFILALNQETLDLHRPEMHEETVTVFNADAAKSDGVGVRIQEILESEQAPPVMANSCILGAFARTSGIEWPVAEAIFRNWIPKMVEKNLAVAHKAYDEAQVVKPIPRDHGIRLPVLTGNEAIGIGLLQAGLQSYFAYPMSPASNLLHFLAGIADEFSLRVIHPESETAAILLALGSAYAGNRAAVGTSGGGFCLMVESLGLSGMAELPVVIMVGQRTGPSTGLATYTAQSDLQFILHAGQGEFPRLVVAPGDAEEACYWSSVAMEMAWKFQIPAFILSDKTICEGAYSFDRKEAGEFHATPPARESYDGPYERYLITESGVSPAHFPPVKGEVIKVNSHTHDPSGITTEQADRTRIMADKRWRKMRTLAGELKSMHTVNLLGNPEAATAVVCWGSVKGACAEVAGTLGLRMVQPIVLSPFPEENLSAALEEADRVVVAEQNETGQLAILLRQHGWNVPEHDVVLRYDGRPFQIEDLEEQIGAILA